jgi:CRISPR-associated protein Cmr2
MTVLDVSIGPVQGFVAQSRRTRDLWGSSYLLAFLAAHAMHGAQQAGGKVVQPRVTDDPLFRWVSGDRSSEAPAIGSVPNHFKVEVDGDARAVAAALVEALRAAWNRVCEAVWKKFVAPVEALGIDTRVIWDRQVDAFWEVTWAAGDSGERGLLARRKHWRSHRLPDEPGDKCTVMHDLQELSGQVRATGKAAREAQDEFWRCVRSSMGLLDLRDDERLCAIALVKRMFPKVAEAALGWQLETAHWPSTVYVGAVPWIRRAVQEVPQEAAAYAAAVRKYAEGALAERQPRFSGLDGAAGGDFARLDANYFHAEYLASERLCPLDQMTSDGRPELVRLLASVHEKIGPAPTFYGLLLADGDRLGKLVGSLGGDHVGRALAEFTSHVQELMKQHDGVTIYAGGDDVLAVLPVARALACASALAEGYARAFRDTGPLPGMDATLSAGLVLAHVRLPLSTVLAEARRLLDDVAKDGNGRGSLAVGVYKRGGLHCQWVSAWSRARSGSTARAVDPLLGLATRLRAVESEPGLSSGLIYRIRETLALLSGRDRWSPGVWNALPEGLDVRALLRAEVVRSLGDHEAVDSLTDSLVDLIARVRGPGQHGIGSREAGTDALLLAHFLADPNHVDRDARAGCG